MCPSGALVSASTNDGDCYSYCSTDHVTDCCTNRCRVPMWQLLHPRAACADTLTSVCGRQIPAGATTGVRP